MDQHEQQEKIIENLVLLNKRVARQNSVGWMIWMGVLYGIGFFIGSAIIATIALGVFGPLVGQIPWVRNSFEAGSQLLHH